MRTTSDPKPNNLKVRLNDNMFLYLEKASAESGASMSEYVRLLIAQDMANKNDNQIPF